VATVGPVLVSDLRHFLDIPDDAPAPPALPVDLGALVALVTDHDPRIAQLLRDVARPVAFDPPSLSVAGDLPRNFAADLARLLRALTASSWTVTVVAAGGAATLREAAADAAQASRAAALADPSVAALIAAFPGAELLTIETDLPERIRDAAQPR